MPAGSQSEEGGASSPATLEGPQALAKGGPEGTLAAEERNRHGLRLPLGTAVSLSVAILVKLGGEVSRGAPEAAPGLQGAVALLLPAALAALSPAGAAGASLQRAAVWELVPALVAASVTLGEEPLADTLRAIWGACR